MTFIPRQAKPPARIPITCKVPEDVATLLKQYAEFLESSQEHVVSEPAVDAVCHVIGVGAVWTENHVVGQTRFTAPAG